MNLVDFSKTDKDGRSIFGISMMKLGVKARNKNHPLFRNLMSKTEEIFFFLISAAEKHLEEEKIDQILESPDYSGATVFSSASSKSEKISGWILDRNIDVAFVNHLWMTPVFFYESNVEKMLKKGINPFVVCWEIEITSVILIFFPKKSV